MRSRRRLPADERHTAILEAAVPLFASKGFDGVTTRELAAAAGVSEALLYKHFPSKEGLYAAIPGHLEHAAESDPSSRRFASLPASTAKLVLGLHLLVAHMVEEPVGKRAVLPRLVLRSLLEDGEFARGFLARLRGGWFAQLLESLDAARRAGDVDPPVDPEEPDVDAAALNTRGELGLWLAQHVTFALRVLALPERPIVDYGIGREELVDRTTRFILRGLGVRPEAIAEHLRRDRLRDLLQG